MDRDPGRQNNLSYVSENNLMSIVKNLPIDLFIVILYSIIVGGSIGLSGTLPTGIRFMLGIPLLVIIPGYALLSALFPGRPSRTADQSNSLSRLSQRFDSAHSIQERGVRWGERLALSFGLSLFIIPLLALLLDLSATLLETGSPYRTRPIVGVIVVFSLAFSVAGIVRRLRLPRSERFSVPVGYWIDDLNDGLSGPPANALLNVVLILSILVAATSMAYALAIPKDGETYSGLRVMEHNDAGELTLVSGNVTLTTNERSQPFTVVVENQEKEQMNYTAVVQLQRLNNAGETIGQTELRRFESPPVPANRTWQRQHRLTPTVTGDRLQLTYLLYKGNPPQNPTERNAYQSVHLSVNITSNS